MLQRNCLSDRCRAAACVLAVALASSVLGPTHAAAFEADARDYEGLALAPNNTFVAWTYFQHESSDDVVKNIGIFRATYVLHFGNLALTPVDAFVPVAETTAYTPQPSAPTSPAKLALHHPGFADLAYAPSLLYSITEDEEKHTHTYFGVTGILTLPTGNYTTGNPLNPGGNRWAVKPQVVIGQRFAKIVTLEAWFNTAFYGANPSFAIPNLGVTTMKQRPSYGAAALLAIDLHPTLYASLAYYMEKDGAEYFDLPAAVGGGEQTIAGSTTVHTLRFNWGIHLEKQTLLLLQLNQDVKAFGGASISRWVGARVMHAF